MINYFNYLNKNTIVIYKIIIIKKIRYYKLTKPKFVIFFVKSSPPHP